MRGLRILGWVDAQDSGFGLCGFKLLLQCVVHCMA